jgi:hypothetical protein
LDRLGHRSKSFSPAERNACVPLFACWHGTCKGGQRQPVTTKQIINSKPKTIITMKTKMNPIKNSSLKVLTLCGLLFAATAAFACEKAGYTVWSGSGTFGSSKKELKAMGDTLVFLGGATAPNMFVEETAYDGMCQTIAVNFSGTTADGFAFSGAGVPATNRKNPRPNSNGFVILVSGIIVSDPVTGTVMATDDGGFKIDFSYNTAGIAAPVEAQATASPSLSGTLGDGFYFPTYQGTLSLPQEITDACPLVQRGDEASISLIAFTDGGKGNDKTDYGLVSFYSVTSTGVPVSGQGDLVINSNSGTLNVSSLTIGDPAAAYCAFVQPDIKVNLKTTHGHKFAF